MGGPEAERRRAGRATAGWWLATMLVHLEERNGCANSLPRGRSRMRTGLVLFLLLAGCTGANENTSRVDSITASGLTAVQIREVAVRDSLLRAREREQERPVDSALPEAQLTIPGRQRERWPPARRLDHVSAARVDEARARALICPGSGCSRLHRGG